MSVAIKEKQGNIRLEEQYYTMLLKYPQSISVTNGEEVVEFQAMQ